MQAKENNLYYKLSLSRIFGWNIFRNFLKKKLKLKRFYFSPLSFFATGGLSIPQQIAAQMAISVLSGNDIGDAIKNAAVSYVGAQIPGMDFMKDGSSFIKDLGLSADLTNTLTNSFNNACAVKLQ